LYRVSKGVNLDTLSRAIGLTTGYLSLVERGRRGVTWETLLSIANALDVPITLLVYSVDDGVGKLRNPTRRELSKEVNRQLNLPS
jgi:transcriptional regulator with XRE-family HTH domain